MSIGIGTLQGRKWGPGFAPTVAFAAIVVITTAAIITSVGPDTDERTGARERPASVVSGTAANTPTEIRRQAAGGTTAVGSFGGTVNTPSELTGGRWARTPDVTAASAAERYDRHQRI